MVAGFRAQIVVLADPLAAFEAVAAGMARWWSAAAEGDLAQEGRRVVVRFAGQQSYWVFEAAEVAPGRRLVAVCVDAHHVVDGKPEAVRTEWLGTRLVWDFAPVSGGTRVTLCHEGLVPDLHCYEVCEAGWAQFFGRSLKRYLDGQGGVPWAGG